MLRVHPPVLKFCLFTRPTWRDGRCTTIPESGTSSQRLVLTPCLAFLFGESRACAEVSLWSVALTHGPNEPSRLAALQCDRRARLWQEVQILPWSTEIVALTCGTRNSLRPQVSTASLLRNTVRDQKYWTTVAFKQFHFFDPTGMGWFKNFRKRRNHLGTLRNPGR